MQAVQVEPAAENLSWCQVLLGRQQRETALAHMLACHKGSGSTSVAACLQPARQLVRNRIAVLVLALLMKKSGTWWVHLLRSEGRVETRSLACVPWLQGGIHGPSVCGGAIPWGLSGAGVGKLCRQA